MVVNRTTSPAAVGGVPATITGTGPDAPLMQGKFGQALKIAPYGRSWAQIFPGGRTCMVLRPFHDRPCAACHELHSAQCACYDGPVACRLWFA